MECKQTEFLKEITDLIGKGAKEYGSWQVRLEGVNRSSTCLNAWWWQKWCLGLQVSCSGKIVIQPHVNVFNVKQYFVTLQWFDIKCSACVPSYCIIKVTAKPLVMFIWFFDHLYFVHYLRLLIHGLVLCKLSFISTCTLHYCNKDHEIWD